MLRYKHHVPQNFTDYRRHLDYFAVSAEMPENYQAPLDSIQPVIEATAEMSDQERVETFNDYIRTLLAYQKGKTAGITQTFAPHTGELKAACGSYARAMKLCVLLPLSAQQMMYWSASCQAKGILYLFLCHSLCQHLFDLRQ